MTLIFHITPRSDWQAAQQAGIYRADSLDTEGFIHCSTAAQVVGTANAFFRSQSGLVLLGIAVDRLQASLRYDAVDDRQFPHLYGALNLDAVVQVFDFEPNADGTFTLPKMSEQPFIT